jgi:hypothetical protein
LVRLASLNSERNHVSIKHGAATWTLSPRELGEMVIKKQHVIKNFNPALWRRN